MKYNNSSNDYGGIFVCPDQYFRDGIDGLKEAQKNNHYTKKLKLTVVYAYLNGEGTYTELALRYGLRGEAHAECVSCEAVHVLSRQGGRLFLLLVHKIEKDRLWNHL